MIEPMMYHYYDHREEAERIRVLQEMLRTLSRYSGEPALSTAVDGSFDRGTENALRAFQASYGLPVTGEVDLSTWERLREVYEAYRSAAALPSALLPFYSPDLRLGVGDGGGLVRMIQLLLDELRVYYDSFGEVPLSGVFDDATASAVRAFQKANLLSETGIVDAVTWNRLAEEYNGAVREDP